MYIYKDLPIIFGAQIFGTDYFNSDKFRCRYNKNTYFIQYLHVYVVIKKD